MIDDDILKKSIELRNSFMQLEKNVELLSVEAVRAFEEWKRILRTSDEIRKMLISEAKKWSLKKYLITKNIFEK